MSERLRNITRMEYERTRGWWVRFQRNDPRTGAKAVTSRLFSDATYGGKRKALAAAMKWRDRTAKKVPPSRRSIHQGKRIVYGYVRRCLLKRRVGWSDVWTGWMRLADGRAAMTSASIERWGKAEALRRVEAWMRRKRRSPKPR